MVIFISLFALGMNVHNSSIRKSNTYHSVHFFGKKLPEYSNNLQTTNRRLL